MPFKSVLCFTHLSDMLNDVTPGNALNMGTLTTARPNGIGGEYRDSFIVVTEDREGDVLLWRALIASGEYIAGDYFQGDRITEELLESARSCVTRYIQTHGSMNRVRHAALAVPKEYQIVTGTYRDFMHVGEDLFVLNEEGVPDED